MLCERNLLQTTESYSLIRSTAISARAAIMLQSLARKILLLSVKTYLWMKIHFAPHRSDVKICLCLACAGLGWAGLCCAGLCWLQSPRLRLRCTRGPSLPCLSVRRLWLIGLLFYLREIGFPKFRQFLILSQIKLHISSQIFSKISGHFSG